MRSRATECATGLAVALDVDDLVVALRMARDLKPWFGVAKVGLELFSAAGPDVVGLLSDAGFRVFLDLKLHDIPTTVNKARARHRVVRGELSHAARARRARDAARAASKASMKARRRQGCRRPPHSR